jgi:Indolepyruvate ferredoxin oxidoreductase, alpha and beta subunits
MPRVAIREDRCKGCGLCTEACPKKILEFSTGFNDKGYHPVRCTDASLCIGCAMCARTCPDVVIEVYK